MQLQFAAYLKIGKSKLKSFFSQIGKNILPGLIVSIILPLTGSAQVSSPEEQNQPATSQLPELGDSAAQYLTPIQEKDIGQQFQRQLLRARSYIGDPEIRAYLSDLGREIAQYADLFDLQPEFNLIQDKELNAFAVPGGFITFNSGLILATDSENELAAVVGHEIAHLAQRHLPRLIARSEANKLPAAAAILASVLVGGQAGLAGLTLANAQLLSNQLAYTREFETEADALGIRYLAAAGYSPHAMAGFFSKIERYSRAQSEQSREFLRTHPLSYVRIAESESRAARYDSAQKPPPRDDLPYLMVKAKLRALYQDRSLLENNRIHFLSIIENSTGRDKAVAHYGLGLTLSQMRQFESAHMHMDQAIALIPDQLAFQIGKAYIEIADGNSSAAVARLESVYEKSKSPAYLVFYLADAFLADGQAEQAKRLVRYQLRRDRDDFRLYRPLSKANVALGALSEAHQADAEYLAAQGGYKGAVASLKLAIREAGDNNYLNQSLKARLKDLEIKLSAQNRRGGN